MDGAKRNNWEREEREREGERGPQGWLTDSLREVETAPRISTRCEFAATSCAVLKRAIVPELFFNERSDARKSLVVIRLSAPVVDAMRCDAMRCDAMRCVDGVSMCVSTFWIALREEGDQTSWGRVGVGDVVAHRREGGSGGGRWDGRRIGDGDRGGRRGGIKTLVKVDGV